MKKLTLIILSIVVCNNIIFSQSNQFVGWLASFNTFKLNDRVSIHNDIQWRSSDEFAHMQSFLFRTGVNYSLNKRVTATAGAAYISNRRVVSDISGYTPEYRAWQQLLVNHKPGRLLTAHRFRLEQRFIGQPVVKNNDLSTDGTAFASRLRYFIRTIVPLQKTERFEKGAFLAAQNEAFVNLGNKAPVNGKFFDQNRLFLAAGYRLSPKFDLEAGFMWQYINGRGDQHTHVRIAQLGGYLRL